MRIKSKRKLEVGDWAYLKLQPYRLQLLGLRKNFKLSTVLQSIWVLAKCSISCLSPQEEEWRSSSGTRGIAKFCGRFRHDRSRKSIRNRRSDREGQQILKGLIKWQNLSDMDATWEDQTFIIFQFPNFKSYWGQ